MTASFLPEVLCPGSSNPKGHSTQRTWSTIFTPDPAQCLGRFREPDKPEGDDSQICTCTSLPPAGLRRSSPLPAAVGILGGVCLPCPSPEASGAARECRLGKKGKPTPKVPSREDGPTPAEVRGPRTVLRPGHTPHSLQQSQPSRARPLSMIQVNRVVSGTPQTLPFSRSCTSHTAERNSLLAGTLGGSHRACHTQSVPGLVQACASEPTYCHSPRDGLGFLFFFLVAWALPLAQGPWLTLIQPGNRLSVLGRSSRSGSCSGSLPFLPPPCLDW